MRLIQILILIIFYRFSIFSQTNSFLKIIHSPSNCAVIDLGYPALDTLSHNSFLTSGLKIRFSPCGNDTLLNDSYIQKTEINGLTKWFRMYHLNGNSLNFKDMKVLQNKDILCAGQTNDFFSSNGNNKHGILMKADSNGYVIWCRLYPRQKIYRILKRSDGNIGILASDSGGFYGKHLKIALLNPAGNLLWCKKLISTPPDTGFYAIHMIEGKNKSFLINCNYSLITLLDSIGNPINNIVFSPSASNKGFYRAVNYFNQNYYITGYNYSTNLVSSITKTDPFLNIIWHKTYQSLNGDSEFHNILTLSPNNLLAYCEPENYGSSLGIQRSGFAFFDTSGVFKKSFLFTPDTFPIVPSEFLKIRNSKILFMAFQNQVQFFGIADTSNTNFCKQTQITWTTTPNIPPINSNSFTPINSSFNYSNVTIFMYQPYDLKIDYYCSNGPIGPLDPTSTNEVFENENISLFPSPTSDYLYIRFNNETKKYKTFNFNLFDNSGQSVMKERYFLESNYFIIDIRNLTNGVYYMKYFFDEEQCFTKKIVVTK